MRKSSQDDLVIDLAREAIRQLAPDELVFFSASAQSYFNGSRSSGLDYLGQETVELYSPVVFPIVSEVVGNLAADGTKRVAKGNAAKLRELFGFAPPPRDLIVPDAATLAALRTRIILEASIRKTSRRPLTGARPASAAGQTASTGPRPASADRLPARVGLPSAAAGRFALLISAAVGATIFAYIRMYLDLVAEPLCPAPASCLAASGKSAALWVIAGLALVVAVAYAVYWATPAWVIRRGGLRPLDGDAFAGTFEWLARDSGLARPPTVLVSGRPTVSAGVFGRRNHAFIRLDAGLLMRLSDHEAIVRHELAHLANRDVGRHAFASAIRWAFVLVALLPLAMVTTFVARGDLLGAGLPIASLTILMRLIHRAMLRAGEHEADAIAYVLPHGAPSRSRWRYRAKVRRAAVAADPGLLAVPSVAEAVATGLICVLPVTDVSALLGQSGWVDPLAVRWVASAPYTAVGGAVLGLTVWRAVVARRAGFWRLTGVAAGFAVGVLAAYPLSLPAVLSGALGTPGPTALAVLAGLLLIGAAMLVAWAATTARTWRDSGRRIGAAGRWGAVLCGYAATALIGYWFLLHDLQPVVSILAEQARADYRGLASGGLPIGPYPIWLISGHSLARQLIWTGGLPTLFLAAWLFPLLARVRLRPPLVAGLIGGACFAAALVLWRLKLHANLPASVRGGPQFALAFAYLQTMLAVAAQALVAAVVAALTRRIAPAMLAAFVTGLLAVAAQLAAIPTGGCLPALSLRPGPCSWDLDGMFVELALRWTILEGGVTAVLFALLGLALARLFRQALVPLRGRRAPAGDGRPLAVARGGGKPSTVPRRSFLDGLAVNLSFGAPIRRANAKDRTPLRQAMQNVASASRRLGSER